MTSSVRFLRYDIYKQITRKGIKKMTDEKIKKDLRSSVLERNSQKRRRYALFWLRKMVCSAAAIATAYLFSGKEFPFETYPLGMALVCSSENYIMEYVLGIFVRVITDKASKALYLPGILCIICTGARYFLAFAIHITIILYTI
jgi:hypothetical protein